MTSDELMAALGRAVAAVWGDLPKDVQRELFEAATRSGGHGAREELARYLHQQHPRTFASAHAARQALEPDSLGG